MVALFVVLGGSALAASNAGNPAKTEVEPPAPAQEVAPPDALPGLGDLPITGTEPPEAPAPEAVEAAEEQQRPERELRPDLGKPKKKARRRSSRDHESGGPPPWAPAHGLRCKRAGNTPGTPAFRQCIKSRKSEKKRGNGKSEKKRGNRRR